MRHALKLAVFSTSMAFVFCLSGKISAQSLPADRMTLTQKVLSRYTIVQLNFTATAMNNYGEIVGHVVNSDGSVSAVFYSRGRVFKLPPLFKGGTFQDATDVNDRGQIVGDALTPSGCSHAVMWVAQKIKDLGAESDTCFNGAVGVNNLGIAVGLAEHPSVPVQHDALEFENGKLHILRLNAQATAINDSGQVVGYAQDPQSGLSSPFVAPKAPNCCGFYKYGTANDINRRGDIVGYTYPAGGNYTAYLYSRARNIALGTLPGMTDSSATALNDCDDVVGGSNPNGDLARQRAFLWKSGKMVDLNSFVAPAFPFRLDNGLDINNKGQVIVEGRNKNDPTSSNAYFLLSPR